MQLVPNDSQKEDIAESEPILCQSSNLQQSSSSSSTSSSSSSSCEITTLGRDRDVLQDDLQSIHIDETSHLVNSDQLQCRICLDSGGEDIIAPCQCRGTQKYVHRSCLDNWRSTKVYSFFLSGIAFA
uniref:RING-CH-type domain-containing protein n=1 Tax=Rhizophora mucronata TaxID=61149 RepID=A0A2P2KMM1_RHIMU